MIDFKKELSKYKPVKDVDDLQEGISLNEARDINELLQYIAGLIGRLDGKNRE